MKMRSKEKKKDEDRNMKKEEKGWIQKKRENFRREKEDREKSLVWEVHKHSHSRT